MMLIKNTTLDSQNISHLSRVGLYVLLLVFTVIYQVRNPFFINLDFLIPIYGFLTLSLSVSFVLAALSFKKPHLMRNTLKSLLFSDVMLISGLLYFAGFQSSLYLFFYLYLIFISAISFQIKGAITMAAFCSFMFSVVLFFDHGITSNTKIFLFLINNISFFVVAYMGGFLSEKIEVLGEQVELKDQSIRELQNVNQLIVDNIKSGLLTLDDKNIIIQMNEEAKKLLPIVKMGFGFDTEIKAENLNFSLDKDISAFEVSRVQNGETQYLEVLISKIRIQDSAKGTIVLIQDVTDRKRQEEQSKTQEKLAAVGQLAAGIAHEIRNPLASMSGSIQLLAKSFENLDDEQKKLIAITLKETDRLNLLISEFLEFVRPKIELNDQVDLGKLLRECVDMTRVNTALKQPEFDLNIQEGLVIQGNRDKLKQIVLNILINGCHAMEKSSQAVFKITLQKSQQIEMVFADSGVGMDESVKKKIFEPFYTTKPKGTGLGLALVHKIVELHKAKIEVDSVLGQGTVFKIIF